MLTLPKTLPHFLASAQEETLALIHTPGVNLCVWERPPRPAISALLAQVLKSRTGLAVDLTLSPDDELTANPDPALRRYEMNYAFPLWLDDMQQLVTRFREISGSPAVRLRLERVADQGCAAFHADSLALRLLCTYHGPGTQWLENDNLRRDELGLRGRSTVEANAAMAIDETRIHTVPAWHVMIFKGRSWPGEKDNALVHRSFPVCCPDHARIRLCLDVPSNYAGC